MEYLIWSNDHGAFWRPNRAGYTQDMNQAGRYAKEEADKICKNGGVPRAWSTHPGPYEIMLPAPDGDK